MPFNRIHRIGLTLAVAVAALAAPTLASAAPKAAATAPGWFAVVDYSGNLVRGAGTTAVVRQSAGKYEVGFNRDMDKCSYTATIGDPDAALVYNPGLVFTASGFYTGSNVHVETKNLAGASADYPFHLEVMCEGDRYWSVVDENGTLTRQSTSVVSTTKIATGQYEVLLDKSVAGCSYVAAIGHPSWTGVPQPGVVSTSRAGNANAVLVATRTVDGTFVDRPFHLQLQCPEPGSVSDWAVVRADGTLARGSALTVSSQRLGVGRYEVFMIEGNHYGCAFVATPGLPGTGIITAPALAFTARGHTDPSLAIYVETKNVGGGLTDFPFHLQVSGGC